MINLELYKVFCVVARCGSLTKAADELYISQPAVSQAIKALEAQLGAPLFERHHKGIVLTARGGEVIFRDVDRALNILENVEDRFAERRRSPAGTLKIGASETIFQYILSDKIVAFHRMYPEIKIELIEDTTPRIIEELKKERCDVGFLNLPIAVDPDIQVTESVTILDDIFVAGEAYSELKDKELTVWDLENYPLLLLDPTTVARASIIHFAEGLGVDLSPAIEVDSWGFMKQLVERGMGIGCLPRQYAERRLREGTLFELKVTPALPARSVGMAVRKNASLPLALKLFNKLFDHFSSPERK